MNTGGYVYFIKAENLPIVKIGYTTGKFSTRRDGIQTMSPVHLYRLGLLSTGDHPRTVEKEMHELFAPKRIWGEWFELSHDEIGTLKRCIKAKKKSRRSREEHIAFDYEGFKSYWKRELAKNEWV